MQPSEEIKEKINLVDFIGERVQLKKAGTNWRGLCPFHTEKSPSFMVSPAKQIWHCFGCGLGGDVFEFVKQSEGVEFREAMEILAVRTGVVLRRPEGGISYSPDQKKALYEINNWAALYYAKVLAESKSAQGARDYLQKRGFAPATIKKWQIGYAPEGFHAFEEFIVKKGYTKTETASAGLLVKKEDGSYFDRFHERVMFALFDMHGRVVGFTARVLPQNNPLSIAPSRGGEVSKYINSPETLVYNKSRIIYGLNFAKSEIRKKDEVLVLEGNVDVITCQEAGFANVVGSSGTALTSAQFENLKRFTENVSFAFDADTAGLAATRRAVELALGQGFNVKVISIPKTLAKDPDELIRKDPALWEKQVKTAQNFLDFYFDQVSATMDLQSNTGKKQAVRDILPLLSLLPDSIDRVHYAQKLAGTVSVDPKVIIDLLNKPAVKAQHRSGDTPRTAPAGLRRSKQEILEGRVLGLFLKFPEEFGQDLSALKQVDFSSEKHQEIFRLIGEQSQSGNIERERLAAEHPQLATDIELLVFGLENELAMGERADVEIWKRNFFIQFRVGVIRKDMATLIAAIKKAEIGGQAETVKNLSLEFNHLAGELSKFHQ